MRKILVVCLIWWLLTFKASAAWCQSVPDLAGTIHILPQVDANTLPDYQNASVASGLIDFDPNAADSTLTIHQKAADGESTAKAVIDWSTFNIGEDAAVHFDQQGYTDWAILNRIHDSSPSQILGTLTGDGHIYLINSNGILFGENSQVNVHSLTASTLNIANDAFLNETEQLDFVQEDLSSGADYQIGVVNRGHLTANENGGKIFLFGQQVVNAGVVSAPAGQVGLAAGSAISIRQPDEGDTVRIPLGNFVDITGDPGLVENSVTGAVLSDLGLVGLYGREIIQNGIIRAVTSPEKTSRIELLATDLVSLGADSWTATPISVSEDKFVGEKDPAKIVIQGITTGDTNNDLLATVKRVEHAGIIDAPSGEVTIRADERVYLEAGSKIDVSGLWVDRTADADVVESYLNSIQLRDDFGQKDGILKGQRVVYLANTGTAVGTVDDSSDSQELTAAEQNVAGGTIDIQVGVNDPTADTCDIIIRDGAELDFSGGGYIYAEGVRQTTKLLSGNKIYGISDAPEWIAYDKILGSETVVHSRYGVVDEYSGIYYGGAVPLLDYGSKYIEGADAGTLSLIAPRIVLDGTLNGSALVGPYQVFINEEDVPDGVTGVLQPKSGTLKLGKALLASDSEKDAYLESAQIVAETSPLTDFTAADELSAAQANVFSAAKLNGSGLGQLGIYTNTTLTLAPEVSIQLPTGGEFSASARRIIQEGSIIVPSGTVNMSLTDTVTSDSYSSRYADLVGRFYLGAGGVIDVSGNTIENLLAVIRYSLDTDLRAGGSVAVLDQSSASNELILKKGSRIDVSGSNGGSLKLQADNMALDGEMSGKGLLGKTGGALTLHAAEVEVTSAPITATDVGAEDDLPEDRRGLTLNAEQLADTGFTNLTIQSIDNLTVKDGAKLQPSLARLRPEQNSWGGAAFSGEVRLDSDGIPMPDDIGATSINLASGVAIKEEEIKADTLTLVEAGAEVGVAPTGSITLAGPSVQVDGKIQALAGRIQAEASASDLKLGSGAKILATGWNQPGTSTADGYTPLDGGTVELSAEAGDLITAEGSLIDVSAASLTQERVTDAYGRTHYVTTAGNPGEIDLAVFGETVLDGALSGHAALENGQGGTFRVEYTNEDNTVRLTNADFERILAGGFDAAEFRNYGEFELAGDIHTEFGRSLTLDARLFSISASDAEGNAVVRLAAPWLRLVNTVEPLDGSAESGAGSLVLAGQWIDVVGDIVLSRFGSVTLAAERDLRVSDFDYSIPAGVALSDSLTYSGWSGRLTVAGDLTLKASRIFTQVPEDFAELFATNLAEDLSPSFAADFTFAASGKITTLPGAYTITDDIDTAGGSLTLEAGGGIDHQGTLISPLGTIRLQATGTGAGGMVILADGSLLRVAGSGSAQYGMVDNDTWYTITKTDKDSREKVELTDAPEKSIKIESGEGGAILVEEGAAIDVSGGGSVYGYQFEPGIEGSDNPLTGNLVIVADPDLKLPGKAIYLQGVDGLADGVYSILPEEYAFRDDAYVLIDLNGTYVPGSTQLTEEGYRIVGGYETYQSTEIGSPVLSSYALRKASDVLEEGKFVTIESTAGNGGDLSLQAATTVMNGAITAAALDEFNGGVLEMSGENIFVQADETFTPVALDSEATVPDELMNTLNLNGSAISKLGFAEIALGNQAITKSVTMETGSRLQAEKVFLAGTEKILLQTGARIDAVSSRGAGEAGFESPSGEVEVEAGATIHAGDGLTLETSRASLKGDLDIENSSLKLKGSHIVFLTDDLIPEDTDGIFVTNNFWAQFSAFENITLESSDDIRFIGDFSLLVTNALTLDTTRIAGENGFVELNANLIHLTNTAGTNSADPSVDDSGSFTLSSTTDIELGPGQVLIDGFADISLNADNNLLLKGEGGLTTGGDLTMSADQVKVTGYRDSADAYQAADYAIDAGSGKVTVAGAGEPASAAVAAGDVGGRLSIAAGTLEISGVLNNTAGTTEFDVAEDINVEAGGQVLARGNENFAGGSVIMQARSGEVNLAEGSLIDVSAGDQGDAGKIQVSGTTGGVVIAGELKGTAKGGKGGSFELDTAVISDVSVLYKDPSVEKGPSLKALTALSAKLADGGFDERIAVRARSGDLSLDKDQTLKANEVYLAADAGQLTLKGTIDASGATAGGEVELHAGQDLLLASGSSINASGTETGGSVLLNSSDGRLLQESDAIIDVSGAQGGTVHLRADRETATSGLKMDLQGEIVGASEMIAEAVQNYTTSATTLTLTSYLTDAGSYMKNAADLESALLAHLTLTDMSREQFDLRAGIEVDASNALTISTINLADSRLGGEPGMLTVRTAGNLTVSGKLTDAPTAVSSLKNTTAQDSWGIALVAGADTGAADPNAVIAGQGDLQIKAGAQVYSETGPVTLAAGNDLAIGTPTKNTGLMVSSYIPVSVGSYAGDVSIRAGNDLTLSGGVIQTAVGDIDVRVGGDLDFTDNNAGAIRTLGDIEPIVAGTKFYSVNAPGGDIFLQVAGSVNESFDSTSPWDGTYAVNRTTNTWGALFPLNSNTETSKKTSTTVGIATLSGGDIIAEVGGDYHAQTGTFGGGNLEITAGGDFSGRFLTREGEAEVRALGSIGGEDATNAAVFEIADTDLRVTSQGDLNVAAVVNPVFSRAEYYNNDKITSDGTYTVETKAALTSVGGDVTLTGDSPYYTDTSGLERLLPATIEIRAGRDIRLLNTFAMLPAADGNLVLDAGRDIVGRYYDSDGKEQNAGIIMNDDDPSAIYGKGGELPSDPFAIDPEIRSSTLHKGDNVTAVVKAGGNIENLSLRLAKMVRITAAGDIRFIRYVGQNTDEDNISVIRAGGDLIVESSLNDQGTFGIEQGGPGTLLVQAGNRIDLGSSEGILTYGSEKNVALGAKGSDLIVISGYGQDLSVEQLAEFFSALKKYGESYSDALASGDTARAQSIIDEARETLISPMLGDAPTAEERSVGKGDIDMVESLIRTSGGVDNIYIIAGGDANVGRTVLSSGAEENSDTGIATTAGGEISVFVVGDLNVNESRVMTFGGGDILAWSDEGDINAGRGSRTAISRPPMKVEKDQNTGELSVKFSPPAVGSGIRALTYDHDGVAGPEEMPPIGDIYLIAPSGIIDAGEAGIAGGRVILGATEVLNAQNISFSFGSVGVPSASDSAAGIGALAGTSSLTEAASLVDQVGSFGPREGLTPTQVVDSFIEKWIDVEVVGFDI